MSILFSVAISLVVVYILGPEWDIRNFQHLWLKIKEYLSWTKH